MVQVLRVRGRRISAENFFYAVPRNAKFGGGAAGTHCYLELYVGSVLSCIDAVYITIFYALTPDLCLFLVGFG